MATIGTGIAREGPVERIIFHKPHPIDRPRVFVNPPIYHIGNGDSPRTFRFENQTGGPVKIWLPNADKYLNRRPGGGDFSNPIEIALGGELELTVKAKPAKPEEGHYQYHVYCEVIRDFAEGNSPPVMNCP
jgi:hypothetical protein